MPSIHAPVDTPTVLRLAAEADADPRTVARVLRGEHVRGRAGERIRQALATGGAVIGDHPESRFREIR